MRIPDLTYVATVPRVRVRAMFMCLGHNPFSISPRQEVSEVASANSNHLKIRKEYAGDNVQIVS